MSKDTSRSLKEIIKEQENAISNKNPEKLKKCIEDYKKLPQKSQIIIEGLTRCLTALCHMDNKNALQYTTEALTYTPKDPILYNNLGFVYHKFNNDLQNAIINYKKALVLDPKYTHAYLGLIDIYSLTRFDIEKEYYINEGLKNLPTNADLLNIKALFYLTKDLDVENALKYFIKAIETKPPKELLSKLYLNMGHIYADIGSFVESIKYYLKAINEDPNNHLAYQNILLNIHYFTDLETLRPLFPNIYNECKPSNNEPLNEPLNLPTFISEIHNNYAKKLTKTIKETSNEISVSKINRITSTEKIRIGYVSSDIIDHAVSFFAKVLFNYFNKDLFEIYIYFDTIYSKEQLESLIIDQNNIIKLNCRYTANTKNQDIIDLINTDKIDILVDLAGHTSGNRFDIFANKNSVKSYYSYIGYPNDIGLKHVRRISDVYTETYNNTSSNILKLERLFLVYYPAENIPIVNREPIESIILGCFCKLPKINKEVIDVFKKILERLPNVKLILKNKYFLEKNKFVRKKWSAKFEPFQDRVSLIEGTKKHSDHMSLYNLIDIHLDTFPYSGTTITSEALYMNKPVITLSGLDMGHVSRVSASILHSLSLDFLIANTKEEYIEKVISLATNKPLLKSLDIRNKFLNSEITDYKGFMKIYERHLIEDLKTL